MSLHRGRRAGALLALALLAGFWAQPVGAFDHADLEPRDVAATVATDADAYLGLTGGACTGLSTGGSTCRFTLTNRGNVPQTFTVEKAVDTDGRIASYRLGSSSSVTSGPVSTTAPVAVGASVELVATLNACACTGANVAVDWDVTGQDGATYIAERTSYRMTLTFGGGV